MKHSTMKLTMLLAAIFASAVVSQAQTTSVLTTGLTTPVKMITAGDNSILVSEQGTAVPNTGRLSRVDRSTGVRETLMSGLPSGVNNLGGPPAPSGPTGLILHGHTLYLTISGGDSTQNVSGFEFPSSSPPSSPIFASVLELILPGGWEQLSSPFVMTLSDQTALAAGNVVILNNADGESLSIRLVVDLPDYTPNPQPGFPNVVRSSNLFGIERFQQHLYVVDAAQNDIKGVNISDGQTSVFVAFPDRPNPLFPFGRPFIEPVPDSIHRVGNQLLVTMLTGFPFVQGLAEVQTVSLNSGEHETLIPGLTSAIDVLALDTSYYTLEFSTNLLAQQPGRIRFYSSADAAPVLVVGGLISPTSLARDENTGDLFVTNIFPGTITRVSFP
jgi:hypothetical protein